MKTCKACGQAKPYGAFPKQSAMKDGHRSICKKCFNARERDRERKRYATDPEFRAKKTARAKADPEKNRARALNHYHAKGKYERKAQRDKLRAEHNDGKTCKECGKEMHGRPIGALFCSKECKSVWHRANGLPWKYYREKNKASYAESASRRQKGYRKANPSYRIAMIFRRRLWGMINRDGERSSEILGHDWEEYRVAMLCRDTDMYLRWLGNMSGYHIDHIIPVSLYDSSDRTQLQKCWHPRNLRIVEKEENVRKSDNLDMDLVEYYHIHDLLPEGFVSSPVGA